MLRQFTQADEVTRDAWIRERVGSSVPRRLPRMGLIVDGVACGHLAVTDGDVAIVDDLVTNPAASSADRHEATEAILSQFERVCVILGIRHVLAMTTDDGVRKRCVSHGMRERIGVSVCERG